MTNIVELLAKAFILSFAMSVGIACIITGAALLITNT
jgi:hypothetical protein